MNFQVLVQKCWSVWGTNMAPRRAPIQANDAKAHELPVFGDGRTVTLRVTSPRSLCARTETQCICSVWAVLAVPGDVLVTIWCPDKTIIFVPTRSNSKGFRDAAQERSRHFCDSCAAARAQNSMNFHVLVQKC